MDVLGYLGFFKCCSLSSDLTKFLEWGLQRRRHDLIQETEWEDQDFLKMNEMLLGLHCQLDDAVLLSTWLH